MAQAALVITLDGKEYRLRSGQATAIDAKDFRAQTGVRLVDVLQRGPQELDEVAGVVWLVRRRREHGLPFEVVATGLNYDCELVVARPDDTKPAEDEEVDDPET